MIFVGYLFIINTIAFILIAWDKRQAVKNRTRIRGKYLLILPTLGGGVGMLLGMKLFNHKTRQKIYTRTVYIDLTIWIILIIYALFNNVS